MISPFVKIGRKEDSIRSDVRVNYKGYMFDNPDEHYLVVEIQQRFSWWIFKFWITVSLNMFRLPFNMMQVVFDSVEDGFTQMDIEKLRGMYREQTKIHFATKLQELEDSKLPEQEKSHISFIIKKDQAKFEGVWDPFTDNEKEKFNYWGQDGYESLGKLTEGTTTYYYFIKRFEGGLILVSVEAVNQANMLVTTKVEQMVVTKEYAEQIINHVFGTKGV